MDQQVTMPKPIRIDETDLILLIGVRDGKTYQEMADSIGKALGTVQKRLKPLFEYNLIERETGPNGGGLHRGRKLTDLGEAYLKEAGHNVQ